jgi:hypothetical protein
MAEQAAGEDIARLSGELAAALRRVLSESAQVAHCLNRIRAEGYDVSVVLEATIGFTRADRREGATLPSFEVRPDKSEPVALRMTPLDRKFLRSLKITVEEEEP